MADPPGDRGPLPSPPAKINKNTSSSHNRQQHHKQLKSQSQSQSQSQAQSQSQLEPPSVQQQQLHHQQQQQQQQQQSTLVHARKSRKETEEKISKLLTRLQRQFSAQRPSEQSSSVYHVPPRPPDQAAASLGRELADAFLQSLEFSHSSNKKDGNNDTLEQWRHRLLQSLVHRGIHPSIPHAFFEELTLQRQQPSQQRPSYQESGWEDWLPAFVLQCEQQILDELPNNGAHEGAEVSGINETLAAALRAYALSSALLLNHPVDNSKKASSRNFHLQRKTDEVLTTTYRRMQSSAGRTILLREFARAVKDLETIPAQMSPLMSACVLTMWATPHAEKTLVLQEIWRQCWDVIYGTDTFGNFWAVLFWMTEALNIFLLVLPSASLSHREERPAWRELAQLWLVELGDMVAFVVHATASEDNAGPMSSENLVAEWIQLVMNNLLPILCMQGAGEYRLSLEPLFEQINGLIVEMDDSFVQLNTTVVFRLSTMALSTPLRGETRSILALFSYLLPSASVFARAVTSTVGAVFVQDDTCKSAAKHLLKTAQGVENQLMGVSDRTKTTSVVQLLDDIEDGQEILRFIANLDAEKLERLSGVKQVEILLLGISLMEIVANDEFRDAACNFVKSFLRRYPHLGLLLTPSLISDINAAALEKSPPELLAKLQFLADTVTIDPSCAQQVWNLLGVQMLDPINPVVLRTTILRLLPRMCFTNKRLYRRVIDTLGAHRHGKVSPSGLDNLSPDSMHIQESEMEIRLSVAASIVDLAKDDLIRDPADCIGWIQEFLVEDYSDSPMNALLVHYAIMALHYLVIAQELDFALVLKVLKKKLCSVTSIDDVQHLPPVIQEALALLLGDGECKGESSEDSERVDGKADVPDISPQVAGAVQVLIDLGNRYEIVEADREIQVELLAKIRRNIYFSLSNYSLDALGLDEDGIKAALLWQEEGGEASGEKAPSAATRYMALRKLAADGIQLPPAFRELVADFDKILCDFNSKMLRFEEETLASSLWKTKGTRHHVVQQRRGEAHKTSANDAVTLPSPATLQALHKKMPSASSSVGRLLCFDGKSLSKFLSLAGEISFQERDPMMLVFLVQAWLNSSSRLVFHLYEAAQFRGLSQPLEEIRRWGLHTGNNDAMYVSMAAMSLYAPKREDRSERLVIDQVQGEIWNAFRNLQFLNSDWAKISLALTAVTCLRWGFTEHVFEIIGALEQSVKGYGGQLSFGAAYGLAAIAQTISHTDRVEPFGGDIRILKSKIGHIVGFLVGELNECTLESNDRSDVLTTLVACLQSGVSTPNLVASLADSVSEQFTIPPGKLETVKFLMISLSLCLPSLSHVNGDLLLGTLFFLEKFQWGTGKGIALVPVLHEAKSSGILTDDEYNVIVSEYGRIFESVGGEAPDFSDDLFYAVNGASHNSSPHLIRDFLKRTTVRFDDSRSTSPLIGAMVAVGSFPCLGFMSRIMTASPQLRQETLRTSSESTLELVAGALETHTDYSTPAYSKMSVMLLGMLASMKFQPNEINTSLSQEKPQAHSTPSKLKSLNLDFALLPGAAPGTLLYDIMVLIQRAHESDQPSQTAEMMRYMRCLESLSLPGHFSKHFLEPLISELNDTMQEGVLSLLVAQVSKRGRSDFTNLALQISIMPLVSFNSLLGVGKAPSIFVKCLLGVIRSMPTELVENGAVNLWQNVLSLSEDTTLLVEFLASIHIILKSQGKQSGKQSSLSPSTTKFLELFVTKRVFSDLQELQWANSLGENSAREEGSILKAYVSCLTVLPLASLDESDLFNFGEDDSFAGEVLRALVVLELVQCRYFGDAARAKREISKVLVWFSRKFISIGADLYVQTMRRVACAVSAATKVLTPPDQREILLSILEQLLLCQPSAGTIGVDLLSIMVGSWCSDVATDGDLSMSYVLIHATKDLQCLSDAALGHVFVFFRHDMPFNLATYGRKEKIGAIISNQIWRLYSTWSKHGADEELLKCLRKAFICGSGSKDEDFVLLSSSILFNADSAQGQQSLLR